LAQSTIRDDAGARAARPALLLRRTMAHRPGRARFQIPPQPRLAAASCKSIARGADAEARVLRARNILRGEGVTSLVVSNRCLTSCLCVNCVRRVGQRVGRGQPWIAKAIAAATGGRPLTLLQATEAAGQHLGSHVLAAKFTCGSGLRGREESESSERHNRRGAPFQDPFDLSRGVVSNDRVVTV
jgi:hypothetical protein